jgi:uncharacterized protein YoxC
MTNEELEKAIQFILQQQAQFWTSLQSLEGIVRDHSAQIGQLTHRVDDLTGRVGELAGHVGELDNLVLRLGRIVEEQGRRTDERLNVLIEVVERYFSNGHKQ